MVPILCTLADELQVLLCSKKRKFFGVVDPNDIEGIRIFPFAQSKIHTFERKL